MPVYSLICHCSKSARTVLAVTVLTFAPTPATQADTRIPVVVSFSILADWAKRIGGDRIRVTTLVGKGSDPHVFRPSPAAARAVAGAQLVIVNGLGFEGWLSRLIDASGSKATILESAAGVKYKSVERPAGAREPVDPHAWHDAQNARVYVDNIRAALCRIDAAECHYYSANAAAYDLELRRLHQWIKTALNRIPKGLRSVVAPHQSFAYFGHAYGVRFHAAKGYSTESEASAADVAALIREIRASGAGALFVENIADPRLITQIGRETGLDLGGTLYSDALSDLTGPAPTYVRMMKHNTSTIVSALEQKGG